MIENRQKTPSGPPDHPNGDPRCQNVATKAHKYQALVPKRWQAESRRVKDWGPAAEDDALKIRRTSSEVAGRARQRAQNLAWLGGEASPPSAEPRLCRRPFASTHLYRGTGVIFGLQNSMQHFLHPKITKRPPHGSQSGAEATIWSSTGEPRPPKTSKNTNKNRCFHNVHKIGLGHDIFTPGPSKRGPK